MTKALVLYNPDKCGAEACLEDVISALEDHAETEVRPIAEERIDTDADLAVVLGGDGSILMAARMLGGTEIPVAGINLGKLGYMAEFTARQFCDRVHEIVEGRMPISRRLMLSVRCERSDGTACEDLALNDVSVAGGEAQRMVGVDATIDGDHVTTYFGDGVLVSTPTGSTAYCMAAGGPLLVAGLEAIVLVPICPHSLTHRPIVLRPETRIELTPTDLQPEAVCVLDGQKMIRMKPGDTVYIERAGSTFLLVQNGSHSPFRTLIQKLHWGHLPKYT